MKLPFILARRFVAGEALEQTIPAIKLINEKGIAVSLDLLGENVSDRKVADDTLAEYQDLIKGIKDLDLNSSISIKLTMMGLDIDEAYTIDNLFSLLTTAKENNTFVRIDMEGSPYTQRTIDIFKKAHVEFGSIVGIVIQAYLNRSKADINELGALGADVRLCKGAYSEPPSIAIQKMADIRTAYREMATVLLDKTTMPRFASHDDQIINWVKSYTNLEGIDKNRYEFQMLYGLRQDTCEQLASEGHNVRIYVPYGTMWVPYFTRRLKERKENIFFVVSNLFKK
jgi:proline dehydrogenase